MEGTDRTFWINVEDCAASTTANFTCAIIDGVLGDCTVGGNTNSQTATLFDGQRF